MVAISKNAMIALGVLGGATLVFEPLRTHYLLTAALAVALVSLLQFQEWRGGVASILNHADAKKMIDVNNDVETYGKLYGNDSRYVSIACAGACV
jgi:hypothetical protein